MPKMVAKWPASAMMPGPRRDTEHWIHRPSAWLAVAAVLTILAYAPGLSGPYLFDDLVNLNPVAAWLTGHADWQQVLFGGSSGMFGRPLSMLSFMLNAWWFGTDPFSFKVVNLLVHLGCGALVFFLCRALFSRDMRLRRFAPWWSLGIAAIWLLHPLQASTVLYIVQRMAQLSALFVLLALLCYVHGRQLLEAGRHRGAAAWLFVAFPLATLAAMLSKENGALAPLFALVLELAYFRGPRRPRLVDGFFLVFLLIPGLAIAGWYALHPGSIVAGYETREFTLAQRLLTQPRVLLDYVQALLLPRGAALGLYGDDFALSTGWLAPVSTVFALVFWVVAAVSGWLLRHRSTTFFAGIFLFLAGHVMESSVFALQLYFEHRNYLPGLGIFMAVAGLLEMAWAKIGGHVDNRRLVRFSVAAFILALGMGTHMRAWSWQTWPGVVRQAIATHPDSLRARLDYAVLLVKLGDVDAARVVFAGLRESDTDKARSLGAIYPVVLDCMLDGATTSAHVADLRAVAGNRVGTYEVTAFKSLIEQVSARACRNLPDGELASLLADIADRAPQSASTEPVWTLRHMSADFHLRAGNPTRAREEARKAWIASKNGHVGVLLAHVLVAAGEYDQARRVLAEAGRRMPPHDIRGQDMIRAVALQLRQSGSSP